MQYRQLSPILLACAAALTFGCGVEEPEADPKDPVDFYGEASETQVEDERDFTEQNYDFTGEMPIADLLDLFETSETVWYGVSPLDPYAHGDERVVDVDCDPKEQRYGTPLDEVDELPEYIEGVVTLHPRYFQKVSVCGQDHRFYGAFYLQDETGGVLVLKDSRVADFTYGNRVRLRVRALAKSFDSLAVLAYDEQEVIDPDTKQPIYYEAVDGPLDEEDVGKVRRVTGVITSEPNNNNFNELRMLGDDGETRYIGSIDRELGNRGLDLFECQRIQVTGPVEQSFGAYRVIIASLGQIEWLGDAEDCPSSE
ncbi:MAG: hypothetical protein ACLFVJ_12425 [Persicimonas sp.]